MKYCICFFLNFAYKKSKSTQISMEEYKTIMSNLNGQRPIVIHFINATMADNHKKKKITVQKPTTIINNLG